MSNVKPIIPPINEHELLDCYRGPSSHGRRGNYPVSKTYSRDDQALERLKNQALFTAIMNEVNKFLFDEKYASKAVAVMTVEAILCMHLGLPLKPETPNQKP